MSPSLDLYASPSVDFSALAPTRFPITSHNAVYVTGEKGVVVDAGRTAVGRAVSIKLASGNQVYQRCRNLRHRLHERKSTFAQLHQHQRAKTIFLQVTRSSQKGHYTQHCDNH